jgi:ABC-2 type transport system ATP-binding protein
MIQIDRLKFTVKEFTLKVPPANLYPDDQVLVTGKNGAGKTVFFYGLVGLVKDCVGTVKIDGFSNKDEGWQKKVGVYLDEYFLIPYLTPMEFFTFMGEIKGVPKRLLDKSVHELSDRFKFQNTPQLIRELSSGNKKKVGLISTLIHNPQTIIWDEPFSHLDEESQNCLCDVIQGLHGKLLLYSEHVSSTSKLPFTRKFVIENQVLKEIALTWSA